MENLIGLENWAELTAIIDEVKAKANEILSDLEHLEIEGNRERVQTAIERVYELKIEIASVTTALEAKNLIDHELGEVDTIASAAFLMLDLGRNKINEIKDALWQLIHRFGAFKYWTEGETIETKVVDLDTFFQEGKGTFQGKFGDEKAPITFDIESGLKAVMDPCTIGAILINMCDNAATRGIADHLIIAAHKEGDQVKIEVMDDGTGFTKAQEGKVFTWGYSGEHGTGLGLANAEDRLKLMGGSITCKGCGGIVGEDHKKGGAKFTMMLRAA